MLTGPGKPFSSAPWAKGGEGITRSISPIRPVPNHCGILRPTITITSAIAMEPRLSPSLPMAHGWRSSRRATTMFRKAASTLAQTARDTCLCSTWRTEAYSRPFPPTSAHPAIRAAWPGSMSRWMTSALTIPQSAFTAVTCLAICGASIWTRALPPNSRISDRASRSWPRLRSPMWKEKKRCISAPGVTSARMT